MSGINEEGAVANENGEPRSACPYEFGTIDANCWIAGWDSMQEIRAEWEDENDRLCMDVRY